MGTSSPSTAEQQRRTMVHRSIAARGLHNPAVLDAMGTVPRERFVPEHLAGAAYDDRPLPIGGNQTISQPYMVAVMVKEAELTHADRVLEVGTGSGYGAAVLSRLAARVWTVERLPELGASAGSVLADLGYDNVQVRVGDGSLGWPEQAPFDAIVVTAGATTIPPALLEQLADGGRLIIPVGPDTAHQQLIRVRRSGDRFAEEDLGPVAFVPLISQSDGDISQSDGDPDGPPDGTAGPQDGTAGQ